jgi:hypothetical protein
LVAQITKNRTKPIPCDPRGIETGVRQFLADKVTGNLAGLWLLVPELLRPGAWDLVCGWTTKRPECAEPRLALQLRSPERGSEQAPASVAVDGPSLNAPRPTETGTVRGGPLERDIRST